MTAPTPDRPTPERLYVVLGEPSGDVHVYDDREPARIYATVLLAANLDAEVVRVSRAHWDAAVREAITTVLAERPEGPGRLHEHFTTTSTGAH